MLPLRSVLLLLMMTVAAVTVVHAQEYGTYTEPRDSSAGQSQTQPFGAMSQDAANAQPLPSGQGTYTPARRMYDQPALAYAYEEPKNRASQFVGIPAWAQQGMHPVRDPHAPFGSNLFQGRFVSTYYDGVNPEYTVMPGDRLLVHIWGAYNYNDVLIVDQQGNIFLPEVGPVQVGGVRNINLQARMRQFLAATFKSNVQIYVNLISSQPMSVYVTGFVNRPGRYAGGMGDPLMYFLDLAGGITPERGSYRDISVKRGGKTVAQADLYTFILSGELPRFTLRNGDVIVVGEKGASVLAEGLIPQPASYENKKGPFRGEELIRYASPQPAASHVSVTGTRDAMPFHIYTSLRDFAAFVLLDGDKVEFLADKPGDNMMISVSGATTGQTRYPVKRNTSLRALLAHIPVDPALSNLDGIYIKRKSVADQQRKAIQDSIRRLENSVLTASSATQEGAAIRVQEAQLIQNFAMRVAVLEPTGVVVVTHNGVTSDILLEDGDEIVIPQRSDVVQINGEVMIPQAVVYSGKNIEPYIAGAGGFTDRADEKNILVIHPNGEIANAATTAILPGDLLMVMPEYDSKSFTVFKDVIQMLYQVAIATGVFLAL